jgi:hypothetical protein
MLIIAMTVMLATPAAALNCRRCRSLPGICLEQLYERIKVTWKTQKTAEFSVEARTAAFTDWCNPSGQCKFSFDIEDYDPFFHVDFASTSFFIIGEDGLVRGKDITATSKVFDCTLRDKLLCTEGLVPAIYSEEGENYDVEVCQAELDPANIPEEAYWDTGQVEKWTYKELYCPFPWFSSADSQEDAGEFVIGALWVQTYVQNYTCDKDGYCVPDGDPVPGEAGCFLLNTSSLDSLDWDYYPDENATYETCGIN